MAAVGCAALGAQASPDDALWYLQIDNDVVFGTDRWYSSGLRLARVKPEGDSATEWGLVQEIYTPEAKRYEPGRTDRMPTARLLGSFARHDRTAEIFQTIELQAGVRGPAAVGRQTTELIHRVFPAPAVDWSRQEPNRLDASAVYSRSQGFGALGLHYGAVLGSQVTLAHAGAELRVGAPDYSPMLRFAATPPLATAQGWGGFVGASARAVLRNELIGPNYDPGGDEVSFRRQVARFAGGVTWSNSWAAITFAVAQDTREFERQRTPHKFGSLTLHASF